MNRAYKLVWNAVSNSWIVASELAKGRKKSSSTALKLAVLLATGLTAGMASAAPAANALPVGESVISGSATFDRSLSNQLTVNQSGSKLITNWNSFDVGSNGKVVFAQPDASSIALNRVTSGSATEIFGQVTANGQLLIVNPNGITFGAGSQVSAASIIASVLDIQDSDFNAGTLLFSRGAATGTIDNQGSLTATGGSVSLLAPTVKNSGSITATGGNASLINADAVDLTANDPVISTASSITGLIQQSGSITATQVSAVGGKILLTGDTSQATSQIQLAGTLDATTNTNVNGRSIVVNGDVALNGASNVLDLTSTDGYSLSNGAAVNLNGASSGFSVNGTAYTVIRDVNQLQAMSSNLAGKYVLAANIDASATSTWDSGAGFTPVGNDTTKFSGVLDGLGHVINSLYIYRPTSLYTSVGLFGVTSNSTIRNVGLLNHVITGFYQAGALVGKSIATASGISTISNSYAIGNVSVSGNYGLGAAGGLVGYIEATNAGVSNVSNSYAVGTIVSSPSAQSGYAGGLVGYTTTYHKNSSININNSYAGGSVRANSAGGQNDAGGLVGWNYAFDGAINISNSYSNATLSLLYADGNLGGLAGRMNVNTIPTASASISNSYASGQVGSGDYEGGLVGRVYGAGNIANSYWNKTTTGKTQAIGYGGVQTMVVGLTAAESTQLASYANWGSNIDADGGTGSVWRIYDGLSGPLLRSFLKPLNITVNNNVSKTYDGTSYVAGSLDYDIEDSYDGSKLLGTAFLAGDANGARNAGTYSFDVGGLYSTQTGYDLVVDKGTLTINKRLLTITAQADGKEYDGKLTSSATAKPVVTGRQRGDAIVGLTQSYLDKNAGTGKTINVDAGYTIRDGNNGNNYDVVVVNSTAGVITPKALTISTVANSKIYDGGVTSANKPVVTGLITGDRVTGLFQQYDTKTVGTGKKLLVKSGYVVNDGNGGNNYSVTEQGSTDGVITAH